MQKLLIKTSSNRTECSCPLCIGVYKEDKKIKHIDNEDINNLLGDLDLSEGVVNKIYTFGKINNKVLYLIGLGDNNPNLRKIAKVISSISEYKMQIELDSFGDVKEVARIFAYELSYNKYCFDELKSIKEEKEQKYKFLSDEDISIEVNNGLIIGEAVNKTRTLINTPYNHLNAKNLSNYCVNLVKDINNENLSIEVLGKKDIEKLKMGAFLAVNKGSFDEPQLITLTYNGNKDSEEYYGLVGKGVMFDTGGYSLKTNMKTMKTDMAGAATVIAVMEILAKLNSKCNVKAIICATDNRIGSNALLPDDVIVSAKGLTIEIVSTDAEGRLTLCDGLWYAQKLGCNKLIDIATLTGACVGALGNEITGAFSNDEEYIESFEKVTKDITKEKICVLPYGGQDKEFIDSSVVADMKNSSEVRLMGASSAAYFLSRFIEEGNKWIHLDIAGTADKSGVATGVMIRSLYSFLNK